MDFSDDDRIVLKNASVVAADRVFTGHVVVEGGRIMEISEGLAPRSGVDFQGHYLLPGLVELHTDHLEAHFLPRPAVMWHAGSAVLAYDAQIAAAGITTVLDSFRVGMDEFESRAGMGEKFVPLVDAMQKAAAAGLLRSDHLTHLRCEVPAPNVVGCLTEVLATNAAQLISLMDHTPG